MRLVYLSNSRIPTEKAHGIQIMQMCEAFAAEGASVILVIPRRHNHIKADPFEYYSVQKNFRIVRVPTIDLVFLGRIGFIVQAVTYAICAAATVAFLKPDILYSRDEYALFFCSFVSRAKKVFEAHTGRWNYAIAYAATHSQFIVTITHGLKKFFQAKQVPDAKIIVAPDAVRIDSFAISMNQSDARRVLHLPQDKKIILYTGHLYAWKGVDTLVELARLLPADMQLYVVGGTDEDVARYLANTSGISGITFLGQQPHAQIPVYLQAADILIIPNSARDITSREYTSPMKLFEYMASGRPIIASQLPSLAEVLSSDSAFFATPDDAQSFYRAVQAISADATAAELRAAEARRIVLDYSWEARARHLLQAIR